MKKFAITNGDNTKMTVNLIRYFSFKNDNFLIYDMGETDEKGYLKLYLVRIMEELGFPVVQTIRNEADWASMQGIVKKVLKELKNNKKKQLIDLNYKDIEGIKVANPRFFKLDPKLVEILGSNYLEDTVSIENVPTVENISNAQPAVAENNYLESIEETMKNQSVISPVYAVQTESSESVDASVKPIQPIEPVPVVEEVQPVQPIEPMPVVEEVQPVQPIEPMPVVEEVQPVQPIEPVPAVEEVQPIQPIEPVPAVEEVQPVQPIEPMPAVEEIQPVQPIEPTPVVEEVQPIQPIEPVPAVEEIQPVQPIEPTPVVEEVQAVQPIEPVPAVEEVQPAKAVGDNGNNVDYEQLYLAVMKDNESANKLIDELTIKLLKYKSKYGELVD